MKIPLLLLLIVMLWTSCASAKLGIVDQLLFPTPPQTPALMHAQCLDDTDLKALANFYRDYEKYLQKIDVFKSTVFYE